MEEGIEFKYEPYKIVLFPSSKVETKILEGSKSGLKINKTLRPITYTPDFVGNNWVMETKGLRTADFDIKWKLFKASLSKEIKFVCLPRNQKQVKECIREIATMK